MMDGGGCTTHPDDAARPWRRFRRKKRAANGGPDPCPAPMRRSPSAVSPVTVRTATRLPSVSTRRFRSRTDGVQADGFEQRTVECRTRRDYDRTAKRLGAERRRASEPCRPCAAVRPASGRSRVPGRYPRCPADGVPQWRSAPSGVRSQLPRRCGPLEQPDPPASLPEGGWPPTGHQSLHRRSGQCASPVRQIQPGRSGQETSPGADPRRSRGCVEAPPCGGYLVSWEKGVQHRSNENSVPTGIPGAAS